MDHNFDLLEVENSCHQRSLLFHLCESKSFHVLHLWICSLIRSSRFRSSPPEVFLEKSVLKICSKFAEELPYWRAISIKLLSHFDMGVPLKICCIFSEYSFVRTPLKCCFCRLQALSNHLVPGAGLFKYV